jgi:hypothetical protein
VHESKWPNEAKEGIDRVEVLTGKGMPEKAVNMAVGVGNKWLFL